MTEAQKRLLTLALQGEQAWNAAVQGHKNDAANRDTAWFDRLDSYDFSGIDFGDEQEQPDFSGFHFDKPVSFSGTRFGADAYFDDATFAEAADFQDSIFDGYAYVKKARFAADADFQGVKFNGYADFQAGQFAGFACFQDAKFSDYAYLHGAKFDEEAVFDDAVFSAPCGFAYDTRFSAHVSFRRCRFESSVHFNRQNVGQNSDQNTSESWQAPHFKGSVDFEGCDFQSAAVFDGAVFDKVPNFRQTYFHRHVSLHNVRIISAKRLFTLEDKTINFIDIEDKYRRLKDMAAQALDHENAQLFRTWEGMAKQRAATNPILKMQYKLYDIFSGYGRSIWRPVFGLLLLLNLAAFTYFNMADQVLPYADKRDASYALAAAVATPFFGFSWAFATDSLDSLFGETPDFEVWLVMAVQGLLSLIFIFLIGLALRNRFRI